MVYKNVVIVNSLGLHARPAAVFQHEAKRFACAVKLEKEGKQFNGKSMLDIMRSGTQCGDELLLICDGEDEQEALDTLDELIQAGLGE